MIVRDRLPSSTPPNRHNIHYLRTKQERAGHWLDVGASSGADETRPGTSSSQAADAPRAFEARLAANG